MIIRRVLSPNLFRKSMGDIVVIPKSMYYNRMKIGNREWVGFGYDGQATYYDIVSFPFPAVRFKEYSNELLALKEKEKGDWRKLTCEEKKTLYRASFMLTYSEMTAPTGQWKSILAGVFILLSISLWFFILQKKFAMQPKPDSFTEENRQKLFRWMIVNKDGHLTGISSKWDYERDDWKK